MGLLLPFKSSSFRSFLLWCPSDRRFTVLRSTPLHFSPPRDDERSGVWWGAERHDDKTRSCVPVIVSWIGNLRLILKARDDRRWDRRSFTRVLRDSGSSSSVSLRFTPHPSPTDNKFKVLHGCSWRTWCSDKWCDNKTMNPGTWNPRSYCRYGSFRLVSFSIRRAEPF